MPDIHVLTVKVLASSVVEAMHAAYVAVRCEEVMVVEIITAKPAAAAGSWEVTLKTTVGAGSGA